MDALSVIWVFRGPFAVGLAAVALGVFSAPAQAANTSTRGTRRASHGIWSDGANWIGGRPPQTPRTGDTDEVRIFNGNAPGPTLYDDDGHLGPDHRSARVQGRTSPSTAAPARSPSEETRCRHSHEWRVLRVPRGCSRPAACRYRTDLRASRHVRHDAELHHPLRARSKAHRPPRSSSSARRVNGSGGTTVTGKITRPGDTGLDLGSGQTSPPGSSRSSTAAPSRRSRASRSS